MGWVSTLISRRTFRAWGLVTILVVATAAVAGGIAFGTTATCSNPATLGGSAFEVDPAPPPATNTGANLIVNTTGCIDWLTGGTGTGLRSGVVAKNDTASGSGDESFGNGTKEDTANPSIVDGGIPPNKSDLKAFGLYPEQGTVTTSNPTGKFLALFWTRVQDPSGTTNMDFELNQKFCGPAPTFTNCAGNHVTPLRTGDGAGPLTDDKLITYDLSNGGTVATISIRSWSGSAWGSPTVISGGANSNALGSINTSLIPANQAGGATNGLTTQLGPLSPRTFGEATISFSALFGGNTCGQFGSAYLKSRSSDTFTSALKDFVPPTQVSISNCAALTTNATQSVTVGNPISDTATLSGVTNNAGGTITFRAFGPDDANCSGTAAFTSQPIAVNGPGNYNSGNFTPEQVGTYRWTADYSGDANNEEASSPCNAPNESSVVSPAAANIVTTQKLFPQDSATLSANAGGTPTGTVDFALYAGADCSGTPVFTQENVDLTNGTANTNNTEVFVDQASSGDYKWIVHYDGDATHDEATSECGKEAFTATIDNDTSN
jgi:hypothetical protein